MHFRIVRNPPRIYPPQNPEEDPSILKRADWLICFVALHATHVGTSRMYAPSTEPMTPETLSTRKVLATAMHDKELNEVPDDDLTDVQIFKGSQGTFHSVDID